MYDNPVEVVFIVFLALSCCGFLLWYLNAMYEAGYFDVDTNENYEYIIEDEDNIA